jgi:hypothetical protein
MVSSSQPLHSDGNTSKQNVQRPFQQGQQPPQNFTKDRPKQNTPPTRPPLSSNHVPLSNSKRVLADEPRKNYSVHDISSSPADIIAEISSGLKNSQKQRQKSAANEPSAAPSAAQQVQIKELTMKWKE